MDGFCWGLAWWLCAKWRHGDQGGYWFEVDQGCLVVSCWVSHERGSVSCSGGAFMVHGEWCDGGPDSHDKDDGWRCAWQWFTVVVAESWDGGGRRRLGLFYYYLLLIFYFF